MPPLFLEKSKRVPLHLIKQDFIKLSDENRRLTFHVSCPLESNTLTGMPEWIQNFYTLMIRTANKGKKQIFDEAVHNCFVEMFGTEKTKQKLFPIINEANLTGFAMERTGKDDESAAVKLSFKISFAARKEIYDWAYDTKKTTFWAAFEESQQELYSPANAADSDSDDDDDDDEDEDAEQETLPLDDEDDDEDEDDEDDEDELQAQERRKEEAAARTTPLVGLVPRRTPSPRLN
ncbi:MAG TPA: hypothetical protein VGU67_02860 [Edaphobacter sp.]|nr:hypothetical protein [Edaphobacter sp.]